MCESLSGLWGWWLSMNLNHWPGCWWSWAALQWRQLFPDSQAVWQSHGSEECQQSYWTENRLYRMLNSEPKPHKTERDMKTKDSLISSDRNNFSIIQICDDALFVDKYQLTYCNAEEHYRVTNRLPCVVRWTIWDQPPLTLRNKRHMDDILQCVFARSTNAASCACS